MSMLVRLLVLAFAALTTLASPAQAEIVKIATWNIENLRAQNGVGGQNARQDADYDRLVGYVDVIDADIVALQEVEGEDAARRVFDDTKYQFFFSSRQHTQLTGFAVKNTLQVIQNPDYEALDVTGGQRHGTDITVTIGTTTIRFMSVHLKSGCWADPIDDTTDACEKLLRQVPRLEAWIHDHSIENVPFVILGDWNRRFDAPGDQFWPEIDDGIPPNSNLTRVTDGRRSQCWAPQFPLYIDHIVLGTQASDWLVENSFQQIVYTEDNTFMNVLSDHCPIAVQLDVP